MPLTTTINLSDIPGVTIYTSKAAALSGAVDSRAAINTYLDSIHSTLLSPLVINCDGWIYSTAGLQMCGTGYGYVTWQRKAGTANAGAVWAKETSAKPKLWNPNRFNTLAAILNTDVSFVDLELDFNYYDTDTQVHDDATWGWAVGVLAAGVKRLRFERCTLRNPRTFMGLTLAFSGIELIDCVQDVGNHPGQFNFDGFHFNGPGEYLAIKGGSITSYDDAVPLNATEPSGGGNDQNYRAAPWMSGWAGGKIQHVIVKGVQFIDTLYGFRLLSLSAGTAVEDVLIDGITGTAKGYLINADPYDDDSTGGVPNQGTNYTSNVRIRNINVQASGSFQAYKPGRFYIRSVGANWDIDLASCMPVSGDTVPYLYVHKDVPAASIDTWTWGKAIGTDFADNFNRADSAAGGVGGTYSDPSNSFRISGNQLAVPRDQAGHNLTPPGFSSIIDSYFALDYAKAAPSQETLAVIARDGGSGANNFYAPLNYTDTLGIKSVRYNGGTPTNLADQASVVLTPGTTYRMESRQIGKWLVADARNASTQARPAALTAVADSSFTAAGKTGISVYAGTGTGNMLFDNLRAQEYIARPTLTALALSHGAKDAEGYVTFTAAPTPSGAVFDGGTWTTTAGVINAFGMLRDVPEGATATVTYTAFGVTSATGSYTETADTTRPTVSSATINAAGTLLSLVFSKAVTGVSSVDYTLSGGATLSSVSGSGANRTMAISPGVYQSQTRTLAYTGTGTVDTASTPNALLTFSGAAVTNNSTVPVPVSDTTPPTLSVRTIPSAGTTLTATLSESGCLPTSGTGGFTLTGTAGSRTVTSWAISGTTLTLTLSGVVYGTDTPLLTYNRAATTDDITDTAGNFLANFTAASVTNGSTQTVPVDPDPGTGTSSADTLRLLTVQAPDGGTQYYEDGTGDLIRTRTYLGNVYATRDFADGSGFSATYTPAEGD